jgi:hypothetical protein
MNWMDKWQRSPRQDRRVVVDGKFVELVPLPKPPEREQSALEVVTATDYVMPIGEFATDSAEHKLLTDLESRQKEELKELAQIAYPTGSLGEHVPDEPSVSEQLQAELEPLPDAPVSAADELTDPSDLPF